MSDGPTIKVEVEFTASTWTDVTAWVRMIDGVTIKRGRSSAADAMEPGSCAVVLSNNDGRFTPGLTTGAYAPNVTQGKRLRVQVQVGATWYTRFVGFVERWEVGQWNRQASTALCTVLAVDALGYVQRTLKPAAAEILEAAGAVAYWPLTDGGPLGLCALGRYPAAVVEQVGADGTIGWGGGTGLPIDGSPPVIMADNTSTTAGQRLLINPVRLPASFTVGWWGNFAESGTSNVLELRQGAQRLDVTYEPSSSNHYKATERSTSGDTVTLESAGSMTGDEIEMVSCSSAGTIRLRSEGGAGASRPSGFAQYQAAALRVGGSATAGTVAYPGSSFGHVFVLPSALTVAEMDTLAAQLEDAAAAPADELIGQALGWLGESPTVAYLGGQTSVVHVPPEGLSFSDLAEVYAVGSGSRFLVARDGTPTWVDRSYRPTPVEVPLPWMVPDLVYASDTSGYVSECEITLADGSVDTYTRTAPLREERIAAQGVLTTDDLNRHAAEWIVESTTGEGRIPSMMVSLMTLPAGTRAADQATVLGLDVASRVTLTGLPAQIPDDQAMVIEGYEESIGLTAWKVVFNLSPDVSGRVLILDDATSLLDETIWDI